MKRKYLACFLSLLLCISLAGCGGGAQPAEGKERLC